MKKIYFLFSLLFSVFFFNTQSTFSQIIESGKPASFLKSGFIIPVFEMPSFDQAAMEAEDKLNASIHYGPTRFAKVFDVDIDLFRDGKSYLLADSSKMWLVAIHSKGALSLNFTFSKFYLPTGGKIFVYNKDRSSVFGAITSINNNKNRLLAVTPVAGEEIVIEYTEPKNTTEKADLAISRVGHDYKGIASAGGGGKVLKSAGACEVDINCPEGQAWQVDKRAVCRLVVQNKEYCSGVLVNNTAFDGTPYVITANHCVDQELKAEGTVFLFNYEASTCGGNFAPQNNTVSGATLVATSPNNRQDFALMKLNYIIPKYYNTYLAGWNALNSPATGAVGIHHPAGDVKKISITDSQLSTAYYGEGYDNGTHWLVPVWRVGATEGGSSGSPLFNLNHQVVGTLTGGASSCSNQTNDYYSKIASAWQNFTPNSEQLKYWLDPIKTGEQSINGYDPNITRLQIDIGIKSIDSPSQDLCNTELLQPAIKVQNNGVQVITYLIADYSIDGGTPVSTNWTGTFVSGSILPIAFPQIQLPTGRHNILYHVQYPNGSPDMLLSNDTLSKTFDVKSGEALNLTLQTDGKGSETWWTLKDISRNTLYSGDSLLSNSTSFSLLCLNKGCYTFTVHDRGGDGLCCANGSGYFSLYDNNSYTTVANGASFQSIDEVDFCIQTQPSAGDAEIYGAIEPVKEYCTTNKFKPDVIIKNEGTLPLTKAQVTCDVDGKRIYTKYWSGVLFQNGKDTIKFDYVKLTDGLHKVFFTITRLDSVKEQNFTNDTLSTYVSIVNKPITHLELVTDTNGAEITWNIIDNAQNIVYSGGPYSQDSILYINRDFCLEPNKCYTYNVFDAGGNGICCDYGFGHFLFYGDTRTDVILYASHYVYQTQASACTTTAAPRDLAHYNFKVYPNPTSGWVTFETDKIDSYEVWLTNISGQQVDHLYFNTNISNYDFSYLTNGVYFLRFSGTNETGVFKLMLNR